jgi:hypothetical protein
MPEDTSVGVLAYDLNNVSSSEQQFLADLQLAKRYDAKTVYVTCPWAYRLSWSQDRHKRFTANLDAVRRAGLRPIVNVGTWDTEPEKFVFVPD